MILRYAFGPLQLLPETFWSLTWADFYRMLDGYMEREQIAWARTRMIAVEVVNTTQKKRIKAEDYYPLPIDKRDVEKMSYSDRFKQFKEARKRMGG